MPTLTHDCLSFSFPQVPKEVRSHFDRHVVAILPRLMSSHQRTGLINELESRWGFQTLNRAAQEQLRRKIDDLTLAEIESAYRKASERAVCFDEDWLPELEISFRRTLRIPDDGREYWLPPGFGRFPLCSVDDYAANVPPAWLKHGGVMMPMYQSEALWIQFDSDYSFAVKIGAGKIDAVSGEPWCDDLRPDPQNYVVTPEQPWLDGFCGGKGVIRQFVAMPLGDGYTVEEQLTGKAEFGGIQLQVHPMRAEAYFQTVVAPDLPTSLHELLDKLIDVHLEKEAPDDSWRDRVRSIESRLDMGLSPGGRMRQEIYADPHDLNVWDQSERSRCFVHLCNSLVWRPITGDNPPHPPFTAKEYEKAGLPWFDRYRDDLRPLDATERLRGIKSVAQLGCKKHTQPLAENSSVEISALVQSGNTRRPEDAPFKLKKSPSHAHSMKMKELKCFLEANEE